MAAGKAQPENISQPVISVKESRNGINLG